MNQLASYIGNFMQGIKLPPFIMSSGGCGRMDEYYCSFCKAAHLLYMQYLKASWLHACMHLDNYVFSFALWDNSSLDYCVHSRCPMHVLMFCMSL